MNETILLIPHFNNSMGLLTSISSIENTEKIDVLIVDDGSQNDKLDEVAIKNIFGAKGRILFIYLNINQGIEFALNKGLEFIIESKQYKFVARLDCGDLCIGKRFEIQEKFLKKNSEIKIVGSNVLAVDLKGKFLYKIIMPTKHQEIRNKMYYNSMLIHPTVMFSITIVDTLGFYPTQYKSAEDYAFFFSIVKRYKVANINEYLVQIEINEKGISLSRRKQQVRSRINIIKENFYFGFYPVIGLIRNVILYHLPYNMILCIKKMKK